MVVTGAGGMLAHDLIPIASGRGHSVIALDRAALDVTDESAVFHAIEAAAPDVILHCAAYTRVDDAESDPVTADRVNGVATQHVARAAAARGALLVYPSTDYVFDGTATAPYAESARTSPVNAYGRSKLLGERAAADSARHLIVRTSWLYGANGRNFVATMLQKARAGSPLRVVDDQRGSPTWTEDLARMILALVENDAPDGVYHAANAGDTTWYDFARAIFEIAGLSPDIAPVGSAGFPQKARRPAYSVLDCSRAYAMAGVQRHWRDALEAAMPGIV